MRNSKTKFRFSLHYNQDNRCLFFDKHRFVNSNVVQTGSNGVALDFSIDNSTFETKDIIYVHDYFMKKHKIKWYLGLLN